MEWITEKTLSVGADVDGWEAAVREVGQLLVTAGHAEARYVAAMLRTVQELGPYIVLAPGLAMPHARPQDGAISVGFAVLTPKEPIYFGNADNDPVRVLVAFCAPDEQSHIQSLTILARRLERAGFVERVSAARTVADCLAAVNED